MNQKEKNIVIQGIISTAITLGGLLFFLIPFIGPFLLLGVSIWGFIIAILLLKSKNKQIKLGAILQIISFVISLITIILGIVSIFSAAYDLNYDNSSYYPSYDDNWYYPTTGTTLALGIFSIFLLLSLICSFIFNLVPLILYSINNTKVEKPNFSKPNTANSTLDRPVYGNQVNNTNNQKDIRDETVYNQMQENNENKEKF